MDARECIGVAGANVRVVYCLELFLEGQFATSRKSRCEVERLLEELVRSVVRLPWKDFRGICTSAGSKLTLEGIIVRVSSASPLFSVPEAIPS